MESKKDEISVRKRKCIFNVIRSSFFQDENVYAVLVFLHLERPSQVERQLKIWEQKINEKWRKNVENIWIVSIWNAMGWWIISHNILLRKRKQLFVDFYRFILKNIYISLFILCEFFFFFTYSHYIILLLFISKMT